jgi:glucose/arabinose dehydrogenase
MNEDSTEVVTEETLLHHIGRIRDVRQGPDGYIYVALEDRSRAPTAVVRLEPAE